MPNVLLITVRFLDPMPVFHGQRDGDEPEWPPSPLRLFQALVDSAASHWRGPKRLAEDAKPALEWLQELQPPEIVAPPFHHGTPFRIAVPNNDLDVWAGPISKGNVPKKLPNELKTMKTIHPTWIRIGCDGQDASIHYVYHVPDGACPHLDEILLAARSITHLGWGIDMAVGDAALITQEQAARLPGQRWHLSPVGGVPLRTPNIGTLHDLTRKHADFLRRLTSDGFRPVQPLSEFDVVGYRRSSDPVSRPSAVFELLNDDDSRFRYPQAKLIHIAGMVRHLAIELMKVSPPSEIQNPNDWVRSYVAGHQDADSTNHQQLSYLPLPSIGHQHTEPGVRRVMIAAPVGHDRLLNHLAMLLSGQKLKPTSHTQLENPPMLVRVRFDKVASHYTKPANCWASVTPVILPGHDDHKPDKTRKLIEKALWQSGIEQRCEYQWSAFSRFPKSLSAHKYDRHKRPTGYIRPDHLLNQTAVHLMLRFSDGVKVPGPLVIGAGRHCGFGLFAAVPK